MNFCDQIRLRESTSTKPFLKWAGGKTRLIERIASVLPPASRLIEPFAGSAAASLGIEFPEYLVADVNADLISLYSDLKSRPDSVIGEVESLFVPEGNSEEAYYKHRKEFNESASGPRKSALFVYLNRHCFNGLCRYNAAGKFNVPFGRYKAPKAPVAEMIAFSQRAQRMSFMAADFRAVFALAKRGDVVYCDPPYVPLSETANFTSYAAGEFGAREQEALAAEARIAAQRGVLVAISNHDTKRTREMYAGASIESFPVARMISRDASSRLPAQEILAVFRN